MSIDFLNFWQSKIESSSNTKRIEQKPWLKIGQKMKVNTKENNTWTWLFDLQLVLDSSDTSWTLDIELVWRRERAKK